MKVIFPKQQDRPEEHIPCQEALQAMREKLPKPESKIEGDNGLRNLFELRFLNKSGDAVPSYEEMLGVINETMSRKTPQHRKATLVLKAGLAEEDNLSIEQITPRSR